MYTRHHNHNECWKTFKILLSDATTKYVIPEMSQSLHCRFRDITESPLSQSLFESSKSLVRDSSHVKLFSKLCWSHLRLLSHCWLIVVSLLTHCCLISKNQFATFDFFCWNEAYVKFGTHKCHNPNLVKCVFETLYIFFIKMNLLSNVVHIYATTLIWLNVCSHCYFTRLNLKKMGSL